MYPTLAPGEAPPIRVLVAIDGSPASEAALTAARDVAGGRTAVVLAVHESGDGPTATAIARAAEDWNADVIVLASDIPGAVVRQTRCPVFFAPGAGAAIGA